MKTQLMALLISSSFLFSSCGVFTDLTYQAAKKNGPYDAIIVPGFPHEKGEELNLIYKIRIFWAYHLYNQGIAKNIILERGSKIDETINEL